MTFEQILLPGLGAAVGGVVVWATLRGRIRELHLEKQLADQQGAIRAHKELSDLQAKLHDSEREVAEQSRVWQQRIEALSKLTVDEAREQMRQAVAAEAEEARREALREAKLDADNQARKLILSSIERSHVPIVNEATAAAVLLPSEEMKGRIIGREGRNIRAFEQAAGVDLVIDERPETVVISSFDPVRREVARIALMNLMFDGRIHPASIEEAVEAANHELERVARESGEQAAEMAKVPGLPPEVLLALGNLRFRTSLGQNVLNHSVETAEIGARLAHELRLSVPIVRAAGLLHDIGKSLSAPYDGPHALAGMKFLEDHGLPPAICLAVGAHHEEIPQDTNEAKLVAIADSISAARRGARRENLDTYLQRIKDLELIAGRHPGVDRTYALQAGREIRVFVRPDSISDKAAQTLAHDLAKQIEKELNYPGQIKVTIIRESRYSEVAT
ncbi:MAG: ribonuclease Y [Chthonomonas sp.]|nr:ribonuclease Y [Chthonomonas sp.]